MLFCNSFLIKVIATGAPFQYPIRRLIIKYREVSKPRDLYLKLLDRSEILSDIETGLDVMY